MAEVQHLIKNKTRMDILYIVGKNCSKCDNFELRISLRSIAKYGKNIGKVYVAGHCPEWLSEEIVKIPFEQPYLTEEITHHKKACNIASTLLHVIDNSDISNEFLVSMDDHIYTRGIDFNTYPTYAKVSSYGEGKDKTLLPSTAGEKAASYEKFLVDTSEILVSLGLPTRNYALHRNTHMSRVFLNENREIIESMISEGRIAEIFAWCGNWINGEHTATKDVLVHGGGEWWKTDSRETSVFAVTDFANHSGLHVLLGGLFPDKCKYELKEEEIANE